MQVLTTAVQTSQRSLKRFRIAGMNLGQDGFCLPRAETEQVCRNLKPLYGLEIYLEDHDDFQAKRKYVDDANIEDLIRGLSDTLQVLNLRFPFRGELFRDDITMPLECVLDRSLSFSELRQLAITFAAIDFCLPQLLLERIPELGKISIKQLKLTSGR